MTIHSTFGRPVTEPHYVVVVDINLCQIQSAKGEVRMSKRQDVRSPRVQTSLAAVLVDSDGGELPVEVIDLSSGGFRLRTTEPLVAGEEVSLRVARYGDFSAQIQWVEGYEAGGRFLEPVSL